MKRAVYLYKWLFHEDTISLSEGRLQRTVGLILQDKIYAYYKLTAKSKVNTASPTGDLKMLQFSLFNTE
jgi:hypothetical protein